LIPPFSSAGFRDQLQGINMKSLSASFAYLYLFLMFAVSVATAQSCQSSGIVHDSTGALVPGAAVILRQPGTAFEVSSQTDDQGAFQLALPSAGTYQLEIKAGGFAPYQTQVIVTPATPILHLDIALAVEGNSQTVEVTADALAAETTSTQLGESLDNGKIEAVPLNGRSFTDLMAVQPASFRRTPRSPAPSS
jgi:hypothetical protein